MLLFLKNSMNTFYLLTTFLCGAAVMIVEIIGTKFLSPLFGSGIFVWSSSITVAMLALSLGYFIGGKKSDSIQGDLGDYLFKIIIIASLFILATPKLVGLIFYFYGFLEIKFATFLSSLLLFFPSLLVLGMVSPMVAKLIAKNMDKLGKDLGFIYSVSTFGSLIGALLAGFVLLSYFSAKEIFTFTAIFLFIMSISYFLLKKKYIYNLLIIFFILILILEPFSNNKLNDNHSKITVLEKRDTFYGRVDVIDFEVLKQNKTYRYMLLDGTPQGLIDKSSNKSVALYHYFIEEIIKQQPLADSKKILFIGVGTGAMPMAMKDTYDVKLVDINPIVVDFAQKYFKLNQPVIIEDARVFINNQKEKNDVIVMDVFSSETIPNHLLTREFMQSMKNKLSEKGFVIFNIIGNPYNGMESKSIINTIHSEFKEIKIVPLNIADEKRRNINYIVLASNQVKQIDTESLIHSIKERMKFDLDISEKIKKINVIEQLENYKDGDIFTDDKNKIDFYREEMIHEMKNNLIGLLFRIN